MLLKALLVCPSAKPCDAYPSPPCLGSSRVDVFHLAGSKSMAGVSGTIGGGSMSNRGDGSRTLGEGRPQLPLGGRDDVYEGGYALESLTYEWLAPGEKGVRLCSVAQALAKASPTGGITRVSRCHDGRDGRTTHYSSGSQTSATPSWPLRRGQSRPRIR